MGRLMVPVAAPGSTAQGRCCSQEQEQEQEQEQDAGGRLRAQEGIEPGEGVGDTLGQAGAAAKTLVPLWFEESEYLEAVDLMRCALEDSMRLLGPDHPDIWSGRSDPGRRSPLRAPSARPLAAPPGGYSNAPALPAVGECDSATHVLQVCPRQLEHDPESFKDVQPSTRSAITSAI